MTSATTASTTPTLPASQIEPKPASATAPLRVSLCLVVWNELPGCQQDVPRLPLDQFDEVYAVDGGSKDGTAQFLATHGIPVHQQHVRGYNGAILEAFERCTTDAVVLFHPKGAIDPRETLLCKQKLAEGYDLAIASRIVRGGRNEEDTKLLKPRKWFVMGLGLLSALLWKHGSKNARQRTVLDVLHGFRGMRRASFFAIRPLREGLSIDLEMVVRGYKLGLRMGEFPSQEQPRPAGTTHFKAWPTGKKLLAYLWYELRRKA